MYLLAVVVLHNQKNKMTLSEHNDSLFIYLFIWSQPQNFVPNVLLSSALNLLVFVFRFK